MTPCGSPLYPLFIFVRRSSLKIKTTIHLDFSNAKYIILFFFCFVTICYYFLLCYNLVTNTFYLFQTFNEFHFLIEKVKMVI